MPLLTRRHPSSWGVIFLCFFLSGATGLLYEVIWLRMLGLVFGHTVYAITTVLAAFMAGLALGSLLFARLAVRIRNHVRVYGWLEIGIGSFCVLLPLFLELAASFYLGLQRTLGLSYDTFSFLQFLVVFTLLMVPTTLMGGTLPVLSQGLIKRDAEMGTVGALYAVNTFGAVGGVMLAGYMLVPILGNRATIGVAAATNLIVGVLALAYSRRWTQPAGADVSTAADAPASPPVPDQPAPPLAHGAWLTVAALGLSGAVSMIYEVAWTRALTLVIGSSTYAFTAMLVAFLLGIAGGSALYTRLFGARRLSSLVFAGLQSGIGLAVLGVLLLFERMPEFYLHALRWSDSPTFVQAIQVLVSAGALLLPATLIGATLPCVVAVVSREVGRVGRDVGYVYAVNTVGAIAGTVLAGFVLIPAVGVHATLKVGIVLNLFMATVLASTAPSLPAFWRWSSLAVAVLAIGNVWFVLPWDPRVMSSGPAIYAKRYLQAGSPTGLAEALRNKQLLFYRDGLSSTVSVTKEGPYISLLVNGKTDASTARDMATQLMSGHLPLLLQAEPRSVFILGLGSGVTVGAVARHPVERIDVAEIEPAVVEASRYFSREHGDVLRDSRVRLVVADARNFLLTATDRYDAIISEPSNPWIGGIATLFSVEFFELAKSRLLPGGVMLQWIHYYHIQPEDLRMVVQTFRTVFTGTTVWGTVKGDVLLLGRAEPAPLDLDLLKRRYQASPRIWRDLDRSGIAEWAGVLGYFVLGEEDAARFAEGADLNRDDRLPLEFSAPRALYQDTTDRNWDLMRTFKRAELPAVSEAGRRELERPDVRHAIGMTYFRRKVYEDALLQFQHALRLDPRHAPSLQDACRANLNLGRPCAR